MKLSKAKLKKIRKESVKQEQRRAKKLGGKTTPASGARWHSKGDVKTKDFLCECKMTEKDQYRLKFATWDKIRNEALHSGLRIPLMDIKINENTFIVFDNMESQLKIDKSNKYLAVEYQMDKDSYLLKLSEFRQSSVVGDKDGKVPVWIFAFGKTKLVVMREKDFETCVSVERG